MFRIWFCEYCGNTDTDDYGLNYIKVLWEDVKKEELQSYVDYFCEELSLQRGKSFGCNKQCVEIIGFNNKKNCLFFEEEFEVE